MNHQSRVKHGIIGGVAGCLALVSKDYIADSFLYIGVLVYFFYSIIEYLLNKMDVFSKRKDQSGKSIGQQAE